MVVKGKGRKNDKASYAEKKAAFWRAVQSQKISDLREGLVSTAMEAQTRNEDGLTSIMFAALNNKEKSLDFLLDWYERRRELRRKGWIDLKDENGRTALMMAAATGKVDIMHALLLKNAKLELKDFNKMDARQHAESKKKN